MSMQTKRLVWVASLNLVLQFIGAATSIAKKLPYEFGGIGDPNTVAQDFVRGGGTALSAPLIPLLVLVALLVLAFRRDGWGMLAVGGITLLAILFTVAGSQEPIVWRTLRSSPFGVFEGIVVALGAVGLLLSLLMLLFGILELLERVRAWRREKRI
jgi:hypothetical protein